VADTHLWLRLLISKRLRVRQQLLLVPAWGCSCSRLSNGFDFDLAKQLLLY
jgi:hypothetical protein